MKFSKLGSSIILGSAIILTSFPLMNQPADARVSCLQFEGFGKRNKEKMIKDASELIEGKSFRLKSGRKIKINQLKAVGFDLCKFKMKTTATLKRPLGKDRKGNIDLVGKVTFFKIRQKVCLKPITATNVKLSKVGKPMEAVIKRTIDSGFRSQCFSI